MFEVIYKNSHYYPVGENPNKEYYNTYEEISYKHMIDIMKI